MIKWMSPFKLPSRAAVAIVILMISSSVAQPQPPPDEERRPAPPEADREPGYLGLIADERREAGLGVRVVKIAEGSPAANAGFVVGDLIVAIENQRVRSLDDMAAQLQPHAAGEKLRFEVHRGGDTRKIEVTLGRRPPPGERPFEFGRIPEPQTEPNPLAPPADPGAPGPPVAALGPFAPGVETAQAPRGQLLGIRAGVVTEEVRQRLALRQPAGARVVSRVVGSPADKAGIPLDAVIVAVDDQPVASPAELARLIAAAGPGKEVELTYFADGEQRKARVTLANIASGPPLAERAPFESGTMRPPVEGQPALPIDAAQRIEQLDRRVRELEQRVQELERALKAIPSPEGKESRDDNRSRRETAHLRGQLLRTISTT